MKNNYEENLPNKNPQITSSEENNFFSQDYYNTTNNFYSKNELDKKYNYYLSSLNKEKNIFTENNFFPRKNEQIEKLLEEEKNIEDENIQRLKELRNKYLSSVKTLENERELKNYFTKNTAQDNEENKLWKICYSTKDLLSTNSRNSFDNINQIQNQNNTSNSNIEVNYSVNTNKINNINNNLGINMSIYEKNNTSNLTNTTNLNINQNHSYNTYKCNESEINNNINKSEDFIKTTKYENKKSNNDTNTNTNINNINQNQYLNLEKEYNKLKYEYNILKNEYNNLLNKYNTEKDTKLNSAKENNAYNTYITKEIEELKNINSNYDYILLPLINYINDIDYILDKKSLKKIDITKLKKNIKNLFPNKKALKANEHPLFPFIRLLQNYKEVIYNNEDIKNLWMNKVNKLSHKKSLGTFESIISSYDLKSNINNIKFKSLNNTKNKISRSIAATPNSNKNDKIQKIFSNRKNLKLFKTDKISNKNKNKINRFIKNKNRTTINTSIPKDAY